MRYACRPAGKPAFYDKKFPGLYNALGAYLTVSCGYTKPNQRHISANCFRPTTRPLFEQLPRAIPLYVPPDSPLP
jgi:hypothetical protein